MSHIPERKEKDCLNCGTIVEGRYCQKCGQENVVPHETFWHMVTHFFYDITHFDSSFFHTLRHLIFKPGFLSKEYVSGRRASYLHPIRMYVFTSAIFFLLFFSLFKPLGEIKNTLNDPISVTTRKGYIERLEKKLQKNPADSIVKMKLMIARDTNHVVTNRDTMDIEETQSQGISFSGKRYKSKEEYDSLQSLLPKKERDGWFMRRLTEKSIEINEKFRENSEEAAKKLLNSILHRLPYMLFISLPLFALILKLVYIRRKQFYFFDHGVFTIHLYIFSFLLLLTVFLLDELEDLIKSRYAWIPVSLLITFLFFYLYKAMRNFYGQGRGKTFLKFLIVAFLSLFMMLVLFVFFAFFSAFTF